MQETGRFSAGFPSPSGYVAHRDNHRTTSFSSDLDIVGPANSRYTRLLADDEWYVDLLLLFGHGCSCCADPRQERVIVASPLGLKATCCGGQGKRCCTARNIYAVVRSDSDAVSPIIIRATHVACPTEGSCGVKARNKSIIAMPLIGSCQAHAGDGFLEGIRHRQVVGAGQAGNIGLACSIHCHTVCFIIPFTTIVRSIAEGFSKRREFHQKAIGEIVGSVPLGLLGVFGGKVIRDGCTSYIHVALAI